jgi:hypothetical protein
MTVAKATPNASFSSRSYAPVSNTGLYTIVSGDLNAAFSNPYSGSVTAPTGSTTYAIVGPGTTVTAGTTLAVGTYTIQASYPGDTNYNSKTTTTTFTVMIPTTPSSAASTTTGSTFITLGWGASSSPVGILRYDVYRGASLIGSPTTTSFTDSTAVPSTAYTYTIKAVDNNGNVSAAATVNVTSAPSFEVFTPL